MTLNNGTAVALVVHSFMPLQVNDQLISNHITEKPISYTRRCIKWSSSTFLCLSRSTQNFTVGKHTFQDQTRLASPSPMTA